MNCLFPFTNLLPTKQLSKAEEEGSDEVEVRREDQDKINRFSRLHQRELVLQEELDSKNVRETQEEETFQPQFKSSRI